MILRIVAAIIAVAIVGFGLLTHLEARRIEAEFDAAMDADLLGLQLDPTVPGGREGTLRPFYSKAEGIYLELRVSPPFADAADARKILDGISLSIAAKGVHGDDQDRETRDETKVLGVADIVGDDDSWGLRQQEGILSSMDLRGGTYQVSFQVLRPAPAAAGRSILLTGRHLL